MMKTIFISLIILFFSTLGYGQSNRFLYEIKRDDLKKPSYIFGTFHLICKSDSIVNADVQKCIHYSDQIYLELDMDDPKLPFQMMQKMRMDNNTKLKDLLNQEDYDFLVNFLKNSVGIQEFMFESTKPLLLYSLLFTKWANCDLEVPENVIMSTAKKEKKEVEGLETVDYQMGVFDKISYKEQAEYLLGKIKNSNDATNEFNSLKTSYLTSDLNELMSTFDLEDDLTSRFKEDLLDIRNQNWIPIMEKSMQKASTFFAVGAGHLGGEKGVLQLLKNKGYQINRL